MSEFLKRIREQRESTWHQAKALLDIAEKAGRDLTAAERSSYDRMMAELEESREVLTDIERREAEARDTEAALDAMIGRPDHQVVDSRDKEVDAKFRKAILQNDRTPIDVTWRGRSGYQPGIERRDLATTSGSGLTGTTFWNTIERHLVEGSAIMSAGATVITTDSGESLKVPKSTANSSAAIVTEGSTISESDPTLGSASFGAFKYAFLVQITRELAEDSSFDVASYLATQAGTALANGFGAHAVTGTGSGQPTGAVTGASSGVVGDTGVTGAFTADNLIDLYHSVAEPYARSASAAWLMRNTTLGAVRKLKNSQDRYLFDVNAPAGSGASGTLLGRPVFVDPNVAAVGLSGKSILFGDVSKYWVRSVRGIRFDRSDDYAFNADLITFRATWRADGNLVDTTGALKFFAGGAS